MPVLTLLGLALVWVGGLWVHTVALTAALPGLRSWQAFHLNITGSAVSNVLPLGGAAGTAVNLWSCRRWGFTTVAFVRWAFVTNLWDNAIRLALPAVALSWLLVSGAVTGPGLQGLAGGGLVALGAYLALAWTLVDTRWGERLVGRVVRGWRGRFGDPPGSAPEPWDVAELKRSTRALLRASAVRVAGGKVAYAVAQAVLLRLCLDAVGVRAPAVVVTAAFAAERLGSLAVMTPGGSGFAELGAVGALVGLGVGGAPAVAGVLLYRGFVFLLEVPVGALLLGSSVLAARRSGRRGPGP
ncbi:hypothetical protein G7075_05890 [Phycicoccus sp. HDW14]|nr:hypothetical protein G7075_05890 [Phycicoccus sp. HDW14]